MLEMFQVFNQVNVYAAKAKPRHTSEDLQQYKLSLTTNCDLK